MKKTCLILSDDPLARQKLRGILDELGLDNLEAAGTEQARKCLERKPEMILVVPTKSGGHFEVIINNLPPRKAPGHPVIVILETPEAGSGSFGNFDHIIRLEGADKDAIEFALLNYGVIQLANR